MRWALTRHTREIGHERTAPGACHVATVRGRNLARAEWGVSVRVYQAINAVQAELSKTGIGKDRSNHAQGYKCRGIDDVYNSLAPLLSKHGLCILPRVVSRDVVERTNAKGTALFYVTVGMEFDFVAAEDGSKHTVVTYGEAMDSGDKATNKAMSAAYKYACMQAFSIPTEGDNDADATTHEVAAKPDPWSAEYQDAAADAAADGLKSYQTWWSAQDSNWRALAAPTAHHAEYKAAAAKVKA